MINKKMRPLSITTDPKVESVFSNYPEHIQHKMQYLRELVLETAEEIEGISTIEETLKWGEPSFITKHGSTLRIDWKEKSPLQYAMYFQCSSKLVETFRIVFENTFQFEGNRAIIFQLNDKLPVPELKSCITACLQYHKVKEMALLGM